jgi:hypothetical protein
MNPNPSSACTEQTNATSSEHVQRFSPDEARSILAESWRILQTVPSYVDRQIADCRGLLESIASQR